METASRRRALRLLGAALLLPGLSACAPQPLRVAAHAWPGYEFLFLAAREGWLAPGDAALVETPSATASLHALQRGEVDGAALTLDEVLTARARGIPLAVVLVLDVSAGADVLLAREDLGSLAGLSSRRIGVERSAVGALMLHHVARAAGLDPARLSVVPLTVDAHLAAWREGRVDALVTFEPTATRLEAEGAVRLFDSRRIPGAILDVLALHPAAINRRPGAARALVLGHLRGHHLLRTMPQDAAYRMSRHLGLSTPEVLPAFRGIDLPDLRANLRLLDGPSPALLPAARALSSVMMSAGLLSRPDDLAGLVRAEFLPQEVP